MRLLLSAVSVFVVALTGLAQAEPRHAGDRRHEAGAELQQQRLARGVAVPQTRTAVPGGTLALTPGLAYAATDTTLKLTATLDRAVSQAALEVTLPRRFTQTPASGIPYAGRPQLRRDAGGHGALHRSGQTLTLELTHGADGDVASVGIGVRGLPAGTYVLPVRWRGANGRTTDAGSVSFTLLARTREGGDEGEAGSVSPFGRLQAPRVAIDASNTVGNEESETWVAVDPTDPQRVLAAGNDIGPSGDGSGGFFLSNNGGATWTALEMPNQFKPTASTVDTETPGGDPIAAADDLGNIWVGGLSLCSSSTSRSHIYVNRIAPGTTTPHATNAAIPLKTDPGPCSSSNAIQDKPQLTIDNNQGSPTYGRLYATWDDTTTGGDINEVISACDTRLNGYPNAAHCDTGSGWSAPVNITDSAGSYITSDVTVGPDGTVYVAWWDYSAANKIGIDKCTPAAASSTCTAWGTDKTIALLDSTGGNPVPFACPILAQPGGRAAPVPSLALDSQGRIYAAWSDLRGGSGTTRCDVLPNDEGTPPLITHETFDSFVATAPDYASLVGSRTSAQEGTRVVTDSGTTATGTNNSDDWFPWVAVDRSTDAAYVDYYSTKADANRKQTHFYVATVTPPGSGTQPTVSTPAGPLNATASDYSDGDVTNCCQFQNDYGDYTGLAAAGGFVYPVWTQRSAPVTPTVFGEVDVDGTPDPGPRLTPASVSFTEGPTSDGDGKVEPGEDYVLNVTLKNTSPSHGATGIQAIATGVESTVGVTSGTVAYPDIAAGASQAASATVTGHLDPSTPCSPGAIDFRLALTTGQGPQTVQVAAPVCDGPAPPVTTPTTPTTPTTTTTPPATTTTTTPPPTTTTTTTTTPPPPDTTAPDFVLKSGKRVSLSLSRSFGVSFGAFDEPVRATLVMRTAKKFKHRFVTLLRVSASASAGKPLRLVGRFGRTARKFLLRHRSLPVVQTVTVRDLAGNKRTHSLRFTLRSRR